MAAPLRLGREGEVDLPLPSKDVSRLHAELFCHAGRLWLRDCSTNGTLVGDVLVLRGRQVLQPGDLVQIGPYKLRLDWRAPEQHTVPLETSAPGGHLVARDAPPHLPQDSDAVAPAADPDRRRAAVASPEVVALRRRIHRALLDRLDLASMPRGSLDLERLRPQVENALQSIVRRLRHALPASLTEAELIAEMRDEALGLGPLERLLADDTVSEIMVINPHTVFVERGGRLQRSTAQFTDEHAVRAVIERIVTPLGRRIDESVPLVDARLQDGSRVNAVIPPLAIKGACLTIRKFAKRRLDMPQLLDFGALCPRMARFLSRAVQARKNIVISGGTGSGKTTLLNVLSAFIAAHERVVTIEDAAELQLQQEHVVSLETRPANMEGKGAYAIRDLVKNALRMRPDRILVGECRGGEALDMLQAMNTGHDGSMTTTHANSPREAISRLEMLCLMSGVDLPARAIRRQIAASIDLVVQQSRLSDGSRRITDISEITGVDEHDEVQLQSIFAFKRRATAKDGSVKGAFYATGTLPSFLGDFEAQGLIDDGEFL
ncbi:MAG: ATPase, T2SS/T4P/T4SS family [Polyangiales bacterium]